jgi:hypothetical protein
VFQFAHDHPRKESCEKAVNSTEGGLARVGNSGHFFNIKKTVPGSDCYLYTKPMRFPTQRSIRLSIVRTLRRLRLTSRRRYLRLMAGMKQSLNSKPWQELVIAQLLLALLLFASPLMEWLARADSSWYLPYLLWGVVIIIAFLYQRMHRHDI